MINLPTFSARRVGGIRFLRLGRLQLSVCVCRAKPTPAAERRPVPALEQCGAVFALAFAAFLALQPSQPIATAAECMTDYECEMLHGEPIDLGDATRASLSI